MTAGTTKRSDGRSHGLAVMDQSSRNSRSPMLLHRFPPSMTVSLRMTGGRSGGGELVPPRSVKRALHFGSY